MDPELMQPASLITPAHALRISQQGPRFLRNNTKLELPRFIAAILPRESAEEWQKYEQYFYACLRTGDEKTAFLCLERLTKRFGEENERIMALRGLYREATAQNDEELKKVLKTYDETLEENAMNMPIRKRKVALLLTMGRRADAVAVLRELLDFAPTDVESWKQLAEVYYAEGLYSQSIHCLEEVLLIVPNAWNMHARLGEVQYTASFTLSKGENQPQMEAVKMLNDAIRRFCRSVELCDHYLRGYYGLYLATKRLLEIAPKSAKPEKTGADSKVADFPPLPKEDVEKLREKATNELASIVRAGATPENNDPAELDAARQLLESSRQAIQR